MSRADWEKHMTLDRTRKYWAAINHCYPPVKPCYCIKKGLSILRLSKFWEKQLIRILDFLICCLLAKLLLGQTTVSIRNNVGGSVSAMNSRAPPEFRKGKNSQVKDYPQENENHSQCYPEPWSMWPEYWHKTFLKSQENRDWVPSYAKNIPILPQLKFFYLYSLKL